MQTGRPFKKCRPPRNDRQVTLIMKDMDEFMEEELNQMRSHKKTKMNGQAPAFVAAFQSVRINQETLALLKNILSG